MRYPYMSDICSCSTIYFTRLMTLVRTAVLVPRHDGVEMDTVITVWR